MKRKLSLLLVIWLTGCLTAVAQQAPYSNEVVTKIQQVEQHLAERIRTQDDTNWTLQDRMKHHNVYGLSMAVVRNYQIEWAKSYGWADTARHRPVTTETRFQAGSISKSLNSVGLLTLVQDKKIDLFADINQYLTTWKFPYDSVAKGKKINTANLLSHTAGLTIHGFPGYPVGKELPSLTQILDGQRPANTQAVRSMVEPGLQYKYSGGGTTISQLMLMDLTQQPYDQFMDERVLKPMGMVNSSYTQPPVESDLLATGYYPNGRAVGGKYHIYPEQAAAGLWTTPTDLCRYIIETQQAYAGKSGKVLSPAMTRLRLTPYVDSSAALGVFIEKKGADLYFSHGGADNGFLSIYYGSLTGGNGVVVMVNSLNGGILNEIVNSVAQVYHWQDFYKPIIKKTVSLPEAILDTYVGEYQGETGKNVVTRQGNQLFYQWTGGNIMKIFPETATTFYFKEVDVQLNFIRDASGKVVGRTTTNGGQTSEAKKIK